MKTSNSKKNSQFQKKSKNDSLKITSEDGFTHLTTDPTIFNRSLTSIKQYPVSEFILPLELIEGKMPEPDGDAYADWLLDNFPDMLVPTPVPDIDAIVLSESVEEMIDRMADGADINDVDAITAAQEQVGTYPVMGTSYQRATTNLKQE